MLIHFGIQSISKLISILIKIFKTLFIQKKWQDFFECYPEYVVKRSIILLLILLKILLKPDKHLMCKSNWGFWDLLIYPSYCNIRWMYAFIQPLRSRRGWISKSILSRVKLVLNLELTFSCLVDKPRLKNPICPTIHQQGRKDNGFKPFLKTLAVFDYIRRQHSHKTLLHSLYVECMWHQLCNLIF